MGRRDREYVFEHRERVPMRKQKQEDQKCFLVLVLLVLAHKDKINDGEVAAGVLLDLLV